MRILAMWLLPALPLLAQIGGCGSIQGVVSDPSGAVIPGASVVATNVATGVKTTRLTTPRTNVLGLHNPNTYREREPAARVPDPGRG